MIYVRLGLLDDKDEAIMARVSDDQNISYAAMRLYEYIYRLALGRGRVENMQCIASALGWSKAALNSALLELKRAGYLEQDSDLVCVQYRKFRDDKMILKAGVGAGE